MHKMEKEEGREGTLENRERRYVGKERWKRIVNEKSKRNRKRRGKIVRKGQRKRERLYCDLVWVEEGVSGDWSGEGNGLLFLGPVGRGCPW